MTGNREGRHNLQRIKKNLKKGTVLSAMALLFNLEIGFLFGFVFQDVERLNGWPLAICFIEFNTPLIILLFFLTTTFPFFTSTCLVTVKMCICSKSCNFQGLFAKIIKGDSVASLC